MARHNKRPVGPDDWGVPKSPAWHTAWERERAAQTAVIRDIAGNPFRPAVLSPSLRTSSVLDLANHIYASDRFDLLPILGDALADAGCQDAEVLGHCRGGGGHWRGC